jgi:serine phosphatase RsbU (regulator of sigma subunit)
VTDGADARWSPFGVEIDARLRLALDAARMGMWDWDLRTDELRWDEQTAALFGIPLSEFDGTYASFKTRVHPDDLPHVEAALAAAIEQRTQYEGEFRVLWPDSTVRRLLSRGRVYLHEEGLPVRMVGATSDVTELRNTEAERLGLAGRSARLAEVAAALTRALTEDEVTDAVIINGFSAMGGIGGALGVLDDNSQRLRLTVTPEYATELGQPYAVVPVIAPRPICEVVRSGTGRVYHVDTDLQGTYPELVEGFRRAGIHTLLVLPLQSGGRRLGALSIGFTTVRAFHPAELDFARTLAALCAQTLARARAYERERAAAESLQRSLLPAELPVVEGLQCCARYLPGAAELAVGGDWYDVVQLADHRVLVTVGDVVGKGVRAASVMGQVRTAMRAYASQMPAPAAILRGTDRFAGLVNDEEIITVVCGIVDPRFGSFIFTNAGHLPPLVVRADGTATYLEAPGGPPIGVLGEDSVRAEGAAILPPGATVILFTDGLVEDRSRPLSVGLAQLSDVASIHVMDNPEGLLDELCDTIVKTMLDDGPADDVALLTVRLHPIRL